MKKKKSVPRASDTEPNLPFEIPPWREPEPLLPQLKRRIWTSHKAKLIERYLYYFVLITKHGSYIYLFEKNRESYKQIITLKGII